jgi:predicted amino acid-binding ACT domain protein
VGAIRARILSQEAVRYLIGAVNQQLDAFRVSEVETRRTLEHRLAQVQVELHNVEQAILAGLVSETTAALVKSREAQRRELQEQLATLDERRAMALVPVDAATITGHVERLGDVLNQDSARVNGFLRQHLVAIDCMPTERDGQRFYRAVVVPNVAEMIKSLGLVQAFDFCGCGGCISLRQAAAR